MRKKEISATSGPRPALKLPPLPKADPPAPRGETPKVQQPTTSASAYVEQPQREQIAGGGTRHVAFVKSLELGTPVSSPATSSAAAMQRAADVAAVKPPTPAEARAYLTEALRDHWKFFAQNVNASTAHLPPDNVSFARRTPGERVPAGEDPDWKVTQVDKRTSPTNVGLYLAFLPIARELGFIDDAELAQRLGDTLASLEGMEKYEGHPYNWYSTDGKAERIPPPYLSTVDNGNLAISLVTAASAVRGKLPALAGRMDALAGAMDFSVFYDDGKRPDPTTGGLQASALEPSLSWGLNINDGKAEKSPGRYDLVGSEALSTYVFAILKGDIDPSLWTNLRTAAYREGEAQTPVKTYFGTAFEVFLPRMFIDPPKGSALDDAAKAMFEAQSKVVVQGMSATSESDSPHGGYKAHGAAGASQSNEFLPETMGYSVIAPYASQMMAAGHEVEVALNLKKIELQGGRGPYGFFEAVAENPDRSLEWVEKSFGHHGLMGALGMASAVLGNPTQAWFKDSALVKAQPGKLDALLSAKVEAFTQPTQVKPVDTLDVTRFMGSGEFASLARPNNSATIISASKMLTHAEKTFITDQATGQLLPIDFDHPSRPPRVGASGEQVFEYDVKHPSGGELTVKLELTTTGPRSKTTQVSVENRTGRPLELSVAGYVEWVNGDPNGYLNHEAFSDMFVDVQNEGGVITSRRRTAPNEQAAQPWGYFALTGDAKTDWASGSRTEVLGSGTRGAPEAVVEGKATGTFGYTLAPVGALATTLSVPAGESREVGFVLGYETEEERVAQSVAKHRGPVKAPPDGRPVRYPYAIQGTLELLSDLGLREERVERMQGGRKQLPRDAVPKYTWQSDGTVVLDNPRTEKPQAMVMSNGRYTAVATEDGRGYSAGVNAQQLRLTPWSPTGEVPLQGLVIRDRSKQPPDDLFSIASNPAPLEGAKYQTEYRNGSIAYVLSLADGSTVRLTRSVAEKDPAEVWTLDVDNQGPARDWELESFIQWAMGSGGPQSKKDTRVEHDAATGAVLARNRNTIAPDSVGFHFALGGDDAPGLADTFGSRQDPSPGLKTGFKIPAGGKRSASFVLGMAKDEAEARAVIGRLQTVDAAKAEQLRAKSAIDERMQAISIGPGSDARVKKLSQILPKILYQAEMHTDARSGWMQSGGAKGGRDQIQTFVNLLVTGTEGSKAKARDHLLWMARHQFGDAAGSSKGKLAHWAHDMPDGRDLAQLSTVSDTHLWLPWAINEYLERTGDTSILSELQPWLSPSRDLKPGELDLVERMPVSTEQSTVYAHARAALDWTLEHGMSARGLPLIAKGDWNDALDDVGRKGKGESVWVGFFLFKSLSQFSAVARQQGEPAVADRYQRAAADLKRSLNEYGWNGEGFYRGFDDDGKPLPIVDALGSWAQLSGATTPERAKKQLQTLVRELYDEKNKMVLLMKGDVAALGGGAAAYPEGVRESGQYTHGVMWVVKALFEAGEADQAMKMLVDLLPNTHSEDPRYKAEPFSLVADILAGDHVGEAGWSWYSGSAGWLARVIIEDLLGFKVKGGDRVVIDPSMPRDLPRLDYVHRHGAATYRVAVENPAGVNRGVAQLWLDGKRVASPAAGLPLLDDGREHTVRVVLGR